MLDTPVELVNLVAAGSQPVLAPRRAQPSSRSDPFALYSLGGYHRRPFPDPSRDQIDLNRF